MKLLLFAILLFSGGAFAADEQKKSLLINVILVIHNAWFCNK